MKLLPKAELQPLDLLSFEILRRGAEVLESDGHGEKILWLSDGTMLKLFRRKRMISSAAWSPYALRFADNCAALSQRGIPCPVIIAVYRVAEIARDAVHYHPLPGRTVRQLMVAGVDADTGRALRRQMGMLVARLHRCGVYFRSLHLGNVVQTPDGELGLIDVADMSVRRWALDALSRRRNFKHLLRYPAEGEWLMADGEFDAAYRAALSAPPPS